MSQVWEKKIKTSEALKKYADARSALFAPLHGEEAERESFKMVRYTAWLYFDGGKAKVVARHAGHPAPVRDLRHPGACRRDPTLNLLRRSRMNGYRGQAPVLVARICVPHHQLGTPRAMRSRIRSRATVFLRLAPASTLSGQARIDPARHISTTDAWCHLLGRDSFSLGGVMFTRTSSVEPKRLEPRSSNGTAAVAPHLRTASPPSSERSVIGNDLKIVGQGLKIVGRGVLQVDGEIEGDVQGAEVIVGERGKVTGMVAGQQVIVRGVVSGVVCGKSVALQASSHVQGDVHHMALAIEQGAMFEGRSRRAASEADLNNVVDGRAQAMQVPEHRPLSTAA